MKFYRYELIQYASIDHDGEYISSPVPNPTLNLIELNLLKETPMGYWIGYGHYDKLHNKGRWISKTSKKRYAHPSKAMALKSFIIRTERRIKILKHQLLFCEIGLNKANKTSVHELS